MSDHGMDVGDHSYVENDGRRVWRCSVCGAEAKWSKGWSWLGVMENRQGLTLVEAVACSETCRLKLVAEHGGEVVQ